MKKNKQPASWRVLLRLFPLIKPHGLQFALAVFQSLENTAINSIFVPLAIQNLIDRTVAGQMDSVKTVLILVGVMVVVDLVFTRLGGRTLTRYVNYTTRDLRDQTTAHLQKLPVSYLDTHHTGDLVSRLNSDVTVISSWLESILGLISHPVTFLIGFTYMLTISWKLLLVAEIMNPLLAWIYNQVSKPLEALARQYQEGEGQLNISLQDTLSGIAVLKAFNLKIWLGQKFMAQAKDVEHLGIRQARRNILEHLVFLPMRIAPQLIVPLFGGYLAFRGEITVGQLVAANLIIWSVFLPIEQLLTILGSQARSTIPSAERVFALLDQPAEPQTTSPFTPVPGASPVEFENVDFAYKEMADGNGLTISGLSFSLPAGQAFALVGPSGCGKSTLFKLICGFYPPQSGRISIFGNDLAGTGLSAARAQISIVSQDTYLFPTTLAENISYGKPGASEAEIVAAAKAANAHDFILEQPLGYQTMVGERGVRLSGGQRQRIAIARAILKDAPILLLDEPTSALDTQSEALVQDALEHFMAGRATLIVAHRLSTIRNVDRVLVLADGGIREQGTHADLMKSDTLYRRLYLNQAAPLAGGVK